MNTASVLRNWMRLCLLAPLLTMTACGESVPELRPVVDSAVLVRPSEPEAPTVGQSWEGYTNYLLDENTLLRRQLNAAIDVLRLAYPTEEK